MHTGRFVLCATVAVAALVAGPAAFASTISGSVALPAQAPSLPSLPPVPKKLNGDTLVFATSSNSSNIVSTAPTTATVAILLDQPCSAFGDISLLPTTTSTAVLDAYHTKKAALQDLRPGVPFCQGSLSVEVAKQDPADGVVVIAPRDPDRTGTTIIKYSVERSSVFALYAGCFGWAFAVGITVGALIFALLARRTWTSGSVNEYPAEYEYGKPWASGATAVAAIGTSLLAGGGVLAGFSPQYQTDGIAVANIVVTTTIAVAPALVLTFYALLGDKLKALLLGIAGGFTIVGMTAQVLLDGLYLFNTALAVDTCWIVAAATFLLLYLPLVTFVILSLIRVPQPKAEPTVYLVREAPPETTTPGPATAARDGATTEGEARR